MILGGLEIQKLNTKSFNKMSKLNLREIELYTKSEDNPVFSERIKRKKPKNGKEDNIYKGTTNPKKNKNNEE